MADVNNEGHPLDTVLSIFEEAFDHPESYLKPPASLHKNTLIAIKQIFDFCKKDELPGKRSAASTCPLQELLVENFDDEQIWQEIELQNTPLMRVIKQEILDLKENPNKLSLLSGGKHIVSRRQDLEEKEANVGNENGEFNSAESSDNHLDEDIESGDDDDNDDDISHGNDDDDDDDDDDDGDHEEEDANIENSDRKEVSFFNGANRNQRPSKKKSQVDDTFFKLSDMLDFLDKEDRKYERACKKDNKRKDKDDEVSSEEDIEPVDYFIATESDDADEGEDEEWSEAIDATESLVRRKKGKKRKITKRKTSATKMKYADFFDPPEGEDGDGINEQNSDADEDEDEDEDEVDEEVDAEADIDEDSESDEIPSKSQKEEDTKILSNFEEKQERLKQKIEKLEKANLAEKPWQLSGETGGSVRPINSLLEEDVSFDHTTTAAPDITEETTQNLEDIVKQRIKDEAWDDVERKVKPVMEPYEYKKKLPLDQEKSKLSLSQIYEQEYLKQTQAEAEEKEIEEHTEIKALMTKLFVKLDALSNFHFTPKPPKPELKVVSNVPVISVEEVTPVTVSDAMMLAPEEVHEKKKDQKGSSEKTDTDRKHARRARKKRQHEQAVARGKKAKLMEKLKPGLGNKYSKKAALKKLEKDQTSQTNVSVLRDEGGDKPVKTSSVFFTQLQDEVRDQVKAKKDSKKKKKTSAVKVSQLKL